MFCNCGYKAIAATIAQPSHYRLQTASFIYCFSYWKLFQTEGYGFQWDLYFIYDKLLVRKPVEAAVEAAVAA